MITYWYYSTSKSKYSNSFINSLLNQECAKNAYCQMANSTFVFTVKISNCFVSGSLIWTMTLGYSCIIMYFIKPQFQFSSYTTHLTLGYFNCQYNVSGDVVKVNSHTFTFSRQSVNVFTDFRLYAVFLRNSSFKNRNAGI